MLLSVWPYIRAEMSVTTDEIRSQPKLWERAGALAASLDGILPAPGEQAAIVGCGTSWFMAQAYAALREGNGHGRTDAFAASEMPSELMPSIGTGCASTKVAARRSATTPQSTAVLGFDTANENVASG